MAFNAEKIADRLLAPIEAATAPAAMSKQEALDVLELLVEKIQMSVEALQDDISEDTDDDD